MARKRLNTKFLIALISVVVVLGGGLIAWKVLPKYFPQIRWLVHGKPEQYFTKGKALYDEGKYDQAAEAYKYGIFLQGNGDAPNFMALGDCFSHLILRDEENRNYARQFYESSLVADPKYMPVLLRMLDWCEDEAELNRGTRAAQSWDQAGQMAQKILAIDSSNRRAQTVLSRAIISKWLSGVETPPQTIDDSMNALMALAQQQPFDAEAIFYVMQAMMKRAESRLQQNDRVGAGQILDQVKKLIQDGTAAQPDDPIMHYRAGLALRAVGIAERSPGQPPKYMDEVRGEFEKAANLIKPDHQMYAEVMLNLGKQLEGNNDPANAEKLYRAVLQSQPNEIAVRVALAELLSRNVATRMEAISLLENPPEPDLNRYSGLKAYIAKQYQLTALYDLINMKLDILGGLKGQPGYDPMLQQIDEAFGKLAANPGVAESPLGQQARGRIELAKGNNTQAVQTLSHALALMPANPTGSDLELRYRLMFYLAGADLLTGQTGEAKNLLARIVNDMPQMTPARITLAQLLIQEGRPEDAKPHIEILNKLMPDSSVVRRLTMQSLDKVKDKDQLLALYQKYPETTPDEMVEKAQAALYIDHREDAIKIFEKLHTDHPQDLNVTVALARLYSDAGDKTRAVAMADAAIAMAPNNGDLKVLRAQLIGEDVGEVRREVIDTITDPFRKALLQYELAVQENRTDDAVQYLKAAVAINPEDGRVLELQFNRALITHDWPRANEFVDKLSRQNRDMVGGLLYKVRLAIAKNELTQAADLATQLVQKMGEFAQSYVVLGQVQKAQKKYGDAIQSFETALARHPQELTAIRELIDISYLTNNPLKARGYIDQGRKVFPNYGPFREIELAHEIKYGDPEKVIAPRQEMLQTAINRKDTNEARAWQALGEAYLAVARSKDTPQTARPFLDKASETLAQAIAKFPVDMRLAALYVDTAMQLHNVADGEKALLALRDQPDLKDKAEPTIMLAAYYGNVKKPAEQEKTLRDYLIKVPTATPVQVELSGLLAKQDKLDEALKILDANSDQPEIRRQRIELQLNGGRIADAEREIQTAMTAAGSPNPVLLNRQAYVLLKTGRVTEATQVLEKSLSIDPTNMEALFFQGSIYLASQKNLPQAISDFQAARDNHFKELEARMLLGDALYYSGDDEAAIREMEDVVRLFPDNKAARLKLGDLYSRAVPARWTQAERLYRDSAAIPALASDSDLTNAAATMWIARKEPAKAAEMLVPAIQRDQQNLNLVRTYCEALIGLKQYTRVIQGTDPLVQSKKAPWWVYQYRGQARKAMDDRDAALDEFTNGITAASAANNDNAIANLIESISTEVGVKPAIARIYDRANRGEPRWQVMMAYLMQKDNDINGAVTWAERVLNQPNTPVEQVDIARRLLGTLYLRQSPPSVGKAVAIYRDLLQKTPNDLISLNNLACTMILPDSGYSPGEALQYSQKAFDLVQQNGEVNAYIYDTQGYVLFLAGRVQEGINLLQQSIDKEPIPEACYHLGLAYLALSPARPIEAGDAFKQAQSLLDAAAKDNKPVDPDLKAKIDKALESARQPVPAARG